MPICITCSTPVQTLYTTYSKADDRTLGKGVRLTQCPNCKRFADKYVEHDYVVLFIDLVLIKPQVYRHLLFNRLGTGKVISSDGESERLDPSILRLGTLLVLFDVYITWARIERSGSPSTAEGDFTHAPLLTQYMFFLTLNVLATLAQHGTIRLLARLLLGDRRQQQDQSIWTGSSSESRGVHDNTSLPVVNHSPTAAQHQEEESSHRSTGLSRAHTAGPGLASPSAISTALLVSSCTKLFPILLVIWPTSSSPSTAESPSINNTTGAFANRASSYIGWVVLFNNIEALLILLDCGYVVTTGLAVAGILARWLVEGWLLTMVGLSRDASGPVGDFIDLIQWGRKGLGYV